MARFFPFNSKHEQAFLVVQSGMILIVHEMDQDNYGDNKQQNSNTNRLLAVMTSFLKSGFSLTLGAHVQRGLQYFVCVCVPVPYDECMGIILDFFDSTSKTLVIYREFWYFSQIFPTLFSQLISIIFIIPLHTFSMRVKTDARLPRSEWFASIIRSGVLLRPPVSTGINRAIEKNGWSPWVAKVNELAEEVRQDHVISNNC